MARLSKKRVARDGNVIDGKAGTVDPTPRREIRLATLRDVRFELAHLYRIIDKGELESREGTRRAYILRQIADVLVNAELEQRVADLEQRQPHAPLAPAVY